MKQIKNLTLASMFLALGILFPQIFHAIPNAGNMILPMHIPVILCGFICGPLYGLLVGLLTPILSNLIFSMPAIAMLGQMIVELGTYGLMCGILYKVINIKNSLIKNYIVLILSMIIGRLVYGICNALIFKTGNYNFDMWIKVALIVAIPGILIQLFLIPILVIKIQEIKNKY